MTVLQGLMVTIQQTNEIKVRKGNEFLADVQKLPTKKTEN